MTMDVIVGMICGLILGAPVWTWAGMYWGRLQSDDEWTDVLVNRVHLPTPMLAKIDQARQAKPGVQ